jgi:hypothetical protein
MLWDILTHLLLNGLLELLQGSVPAPLFQKLDFSNAASPGKFMKVSQ